MADTNATPQRPFVSILMPIGDDIETIVRALGSALDQDYPRDLMEVIAVDYGALDGTRDVAMRATYDKRMRLLDLPGRTPAVALDYALESARGAVIVLLDGQTAVPSGYIAGCVAALESNGGDVALGRLHFTGASHWAEASAQATAFTVGPQPVAYRRGALAGGALERTTLLQTIPQARAVRLPAELTAIRPGPATFAELWAYHFKRGQAAAVSIKQNSATINPQHLFGGAVVALTSCSLVALVVRPLRPAVLRVWRWYLLLLALLALRVVNSPTHTPKGRGNAPPPQPDELLPYIPFILGAIHLSYGCGLLVGLLRGGG